MIGINAMIGKQAFEHFDSAILKGKFQRG